MPVIQVTALTPWFCDGPSYNGQAVRAAENAATFFSGSGGQVYGGVVASTTRLGVTAGGGLSVNVATGYCVVPSSTGAAYGGYLTGLTSVANLSVQSGPVTPDTRIDLICMTVNDVGSSSSSAYVQIITGTASTSPSVPPTPSNSVALAQINVPSGMGTVVNGDIQNYKVLTTAAGGVLPVPGIATAPAGYTGMLCVDVNTGILYHNPFAGPEQIQALPWPAQYSVITPTGSNVGVGVANGAQGILLSETITTDGSTDIRIACHWPAIYGTANLGNGVAGTMYLYIDGTKVASSYAWNPSDSGTTQGTAVLHGGGQLTHTTNGANNPADTPTAATHTITWQMKAFYAASDDVWVYSQPGEPAWLRVEPVNL